MAEGIMARKPRASKKSKKPVDVPVADLDQPVSAPKQASKNSLNLKYGAGLHKLESGAENAIADYLRTEHPDVQSFVVFGWAIGKGYISLVYHPIGTHIGLRKARIKF
jgi:hypothetical protein